MLTSETLQKSLEEALGAVRSREVDLARAQHALSEAERELELLGELAQLRGVELPAAMCEGVGGGMTATAQDAPAGRRRKGFGAAETLLAAVIEILKDAGTSMQIRDLMAAVKERQVRIPGQGAQANLISVISRDPRIVRPRRGYYGLAEWGLTDERRSNRSPVRRKASSRR